MANAAGSSRFTVLALGGIGLLSLFLNTFNNDIPMRYHPDERKKVRFLQRGGDDFKHPLLMLQVNRLCNRVCGFAGKDELLALGRTVNAVLGALTALTAFFIAARFLPAAWALAAALAVAVSPILVIHAHYFKEDIILTATVGLCLYLLIRLLERPSIRRAAGVGVMAGLAASAHYKGALMLLFVPACCLASGRLRRPGLMAAAVLPALPVFAAVNYPLFGRPAGFAEGIAWSSRQALHGHHLRVTASHFLLGFHLGFSLLPGMTWLPLALGLLGVATAAFSFRRCPPGVRVLLGGALVFYFAVELSPMKAFPGYMRYALPVAPALSILGIWALARWGRTLPAGPRAWLPLLAATAIAWPAITSARLAWHLGNDTRDRLRARLAVSGARFFRESYTGEDKDVDSLAFADLGEVRAAGYEYAVASSFMYGRFELGARLGRQDDAVYAVHARYRRIFECPYEEIRPVYRSFALSNPVIRVVDIRGLPAGAAGSGKGGR